MYTKYLIKNAVGFSVAVIITILSAGGAAWALTAEVEPRSIPINIMYDGARLSIRGESDVNDDIIVKISSAAADAHMKYKGKAAGLFWMKMGDISFEQVPATYLLYTSRSLDAMLQDEERLREGIGFAAIKARAAVESSSGEMDPDRWISEFVKFKQSEKLYQIQEGAITRIHGTTGNEYQLEVKWPSQAAPGTYTVDVLAVRDGRVAERAETSLTVTRTGMVAMLSDLAVNQAAIYGVIAIVVAMCAGFAVGALFKKGGGAH